MGSSLPATPDSSAGTGAAPGFSRVPGLPAADWPVWSAPLALVAGLVLAALGGLIVDIPAALLGVNVGSSHVPGGVELADTFVQDAGFVCAAVFCARMGNRKVGSWQFGLRRASLWRAVLLVVVVLVGFLLFSVIWATALDVSTKEKVLEQLGANEATSLLLLSALLTCVMAPICEEFLFRGYVFRALCNWKGMWPAAILTAILFGGFHVGSAPVVDLVPLAALGFGLCLLYRFTGSLYPCIVVHSLNNSLAFGDLEGWGAGETLALTVGALAAIALVAFTARRCGIISAERGPGIVGAT